MTRVCACMTDTGQPCRIPVTAYRDGLCTGYRCGIHGLLTADMTEMSAVCAPESDAGNNQPNDFDHKIEMIRRGENIFQ